jgi:hypothetical protein
LTAGNRYCFGITNYTGTPGGSYRWQVTTPGRDDAFEENDSLSQAYNLGAVTTRTVNGLIMADAADWFRFSFTGTGDANAFVSIAFEHSKGDMDLRLYDNAGNMVRVSDGITNVERISLEGMAGGTYFVQAYGYRGATNPSYSLTVSASAVRSALNKTLYLKFDGATISRADLVRWAGSDWAANISNLDADGNGINVARFLDGRADREQIISRMIQLVQQDLSPFGITVRRHTGAVIENQRATTIFLGRSTLSNGNVHVACDVDLDGNDNKTDIAFVGDEYWGSVESTALAMADVVLHEAGHTYGLWHVSSGSATESMGLRYNNPESAWVQNTGFLDRTFIEFTDQNGFRHGPGPQNSFQSMRRNVGAPTAASTTIVTVDTSSEGVLAVTAGSLADRIDIQRLANGRFYDLGNGLDEIRVYTRGDARDQVNVLNDLGGVTVNTDRSVTMETRQDDKLDEPAAWIFSGMQARQSTDTPGCGCAFCSAPVRQEMSPSFFTGIDL